MKLSFRPYIRYKFLNSLFTGMVGGSVFSIYGSLSPSTFSIGGIILALGLMAMAYAYRYLMNLRSFFIFSLGAEIIMLLMVGYFLLFPHHILTALIIYGCYQLSYMLGGYLIRAETYFARKSRLMGWIDVRKQQGYLAGLLFSLGFYKTLEYNGVSAAQMQVYWLHLPLFLLEILIIFYLLKGFKRHDL